MDKRKALELLGGNVKAYDEEQGRLKELEELKKDMKSYLDEVVLVFFDKNGRFGVNDTARLYNAEDIQSFNIPVLEPGGNCKATPGFLPKIKSTVLNKALREGGDLALPIFADTNASVNCLGFVICRGGDRFEILDTNPFGDNEYSKDELFGVMRDVRWKGSIIEKAQKYVDKGESLTIDIEGNFFLPDSQYTDEQIAIKKKLVGNEQS